MPANDIRAAVQVKVLYANYKLIRSKIKLRFLQHDYGANDMTAKAKLFQKAVFFIGKFPPAVNE